jgi:hypothetical protein
MILFRVLFVVREARLIEIDGSYKEVGFFKAEYVVASCKCEAQKLASAKVVSQIRKRIFQGGLFCEPEVHLKTHSISMSYNFFGLWFEEGFIFFQISKNNNPAS